MRINLKAICLGWLLDFGGQIVVGIPLAAAMLALLLHEQSSLHATDPAGLQAALETSNLFHGLSLCTEVFFTVCGAFVTAHIARAAPILNAGGMGILAVTTGTLFSIGSFATAPVWYSVVSLVIVLPLAVLGGYLRARTRKSNAPAAPVSRPPIPEPY